MTTIPELLNVLQAVLANSAIAPIIAAAFVFAVATLTIQVFRTFITYTPQNQNRVNEQKSKEQRPYYDEPVSLPTDQEYTIGTDGELVEYHHIED